MEGLGRKNSLAQTFHGFLFTIHIAIDDLYKGINLDESILEEE